MHQTPDSMMIDKDRDAPVKFDLEMLRPVLQLCSGSDNRLYSLAILIGRAKQPITYLWKSAILAVAVAPTHVVISSCRRRSIWSECLIEGGSIKISYAPYRHIVKWFARHSSYPQDWISRPVRCGGMSIRIVPAVICTNGQITAALASISSSILPTTRSGSSRWI